MNDDNPHHQRIPPDTQPSQAQLTHEDELQYPPDIVGDSPSPFPSISSPHSPPRRQADELTLYYNSDNELSDFPPIRVGDASPLFPPLTPPVSRYHLRPRPPVVPRRLLQESPTRGKGEPGMYRRLNPNKGLGSANVLNTIDQAVPVQVILLLHVAMLIANGSLFSAGQIHVEARLGKQRCC